MKIRNGFVSNSSSTSFCIIGVENTSIIKQIIEAENKNFGENGKDMLEYGYNKGKFVIFYGNYDVYDVGIDAKPLLQEMDIKQAKKWFQKYIKDNLRIDIPLEKIDLFFGEAGND